MEKPNSKYIDFDSMKESYSDPEKKKKIYKIGGVVIILLLVLPKIIPPYHFRNPGQVYRRGN